MIASTSINEIDYTKHINVGAPKQEVGTIDPNILLQKILIELQKLNGIVPTTYHVIYSLDTTITSKQKIDIVLDNSNYATEMTVIDSGGGISININNENQSIEVHRDMRIINEKIEHIYWIGSGNTGTAKIRFGLIG